MKKFMLLAAVSVMLTGCGTDMADSVSGTEEPVTTVTEEAGIDEQSYVLEGVVYDVSGDTLLIDCHEGGKFTASFNRLPEDIAPGDTVNVEHTGYVLECYPAVISEVLDVNVTQKAQRPMQYVSGSGDNFAYSLLAPADWTLSEPEIFPEKGGSRLTAPDGSGALEIVCNDLAVCGTGLTIIEKQLGGMQCLLYSYSEGSWEFAAFPDYEGFYIANSAAEGYYDDIYAMLDTLEIM